MLKKTSARISSLGFQVITLQTGRLPAARLVSSYLDQMARSIQ